MTVSIRSAHRALALSAVLAAPLPASAQDAVQGACTAVDESRLIVVVLCPDGLGQADWAAAGRFFCGDRQVCGAWVWADPDAVPATAPDNHDGLTQAQITSALGVWVAEQQSFVAIAAEN